jgi:WD40 repeat protein
VSGVFEVRVRSLENMEESQGGVTFNYKFQGSVVGRSMIAFMKPELTTDKTSDEVIDTLLAGYNSMFYQDKNVRASVLLREDAEALGRASRYAEIDFPEFPGMGIKVLSEGGRQVDADFTGFFHIVPIGDLHLIQRELPVRYLLVQTMVAKPFEGRTDDHEKFLARIKLLVAGHEIVFSSTRDGNYDIYTTSADGSIPFRLTSHPAHDAFPVWSPDGTRIAFTSDRDGNSEIYVINADGSNLTRLTDNPAHDAFPDWSPDGTKIAFASNSDGVPGIYVIDVDGSNRARLTPPAPDLMVAWSPDGTRIAFTSMRDGNSEIYVTNADGSNGTRLTDNPANDGFPDWSPDGTKIAFISDRDGNTEIYVMNADGSGLVRLTHDPATDIVPAWSRDGAKIVFHSERDGNYEIYVMNADGTGLVNLTNHPGIDVEADW